MTLSSLGKLFVEDSACQAFENGGTGITVPREFPLDLLLPLAALLTLDQRHASGFLLKDFTYCAVGKIVDGFNVLRDLIFYKVLFAVRHYPIGCVLHSRLHGNKSFNPFTGICFRDPYGAGNEDLRVRIRTSSTSLE
jgi:hypothetical protein